MFRLVVERMLLSERYFEEKRKSYPVFTKFVEVYLRDRYRDWHTLIKSNVCPFCAMRLDTPVQLYAHLTNATRCGIKLRNLIDSLLRLFSEVKDGSCKRLYISSRNDLLWLLEVYGVEKTIEYCRNKNAKKKLRDGVN